MVNIGLIALDIDGTLLDDAGRCSEYTIGVLKKAQGMGIRVCAVTARPERNTHDLLFAFDGVACLAGAKVIADGTVIARETFPMSQAQRLYAAFTERYPTATVSIEGGDAFFGNFEDEVCQKRDIMAEPEGAADKIYLSLPDDGAEAYLIGHLPEGLTHERYGAFALVMRAGVDKLFGTRKLCEHFGVPLSQAMALGNGSDDLCMINGTGYGAAMLNTPEALRNRARRVTPQDNNHDGAARYIAEVLGL